MELIGGWDWEWKACLARWQWQIRRQWRQGRIWWRPGPPAGSSRAPGRSSQPPTPAQNSSALEHRTGRLSKLCPYGKFLVAYGKLSSHSYSLHVAEEKMQNFVRYGSILKIIQILRPTKWRKVGKPRVFLHRKIRIFLLNQKLRNIVFLGTKIFLEERRGHGERLSSWNIVSV